MVGKFVLILSLFLVATASFAADSDLKKLQTGDDSSQWEAVGRIDINGRGFCTGALVAPDLVLTAAHCLFDRDTGERFDLSQVEFLAGWRNGRASAYRWVRRVAIHPDYSFDARVDPDRVRNDIALLQLHHPIRKSRVVPFLTDIRPRKGQRIGLVSYARGRSEAPSLQEICDVLARQQGVLVMSCDVDFGSSGAPVFSFEHGEPRIVSVISAMADVDGRKVALGTQLERPLQMLRDIIRNEGGPGMDGTARLFSNGKNRRTGAKVAKPAAD